MYKYISLILYYSVLIHLPSRSITNVGIYLRSFF